MSFKQSPRTMMLICW